MKDQVKRKEKKLFRVYFNQVNQTRFDIVAKSREEAVKKAEREWRQGYGYPSGCHVEES